MESGPQPMAPVETPSKASREAPPMMSVVVPVYDEEGAATSLAREIATAFAGMDFEILFVDDASRDGTRV